MKIKLFNNDSNGIMLSDISKAIEYAQRNSIAEAMITYENGSHINCDFKDVDMAVEFLIKLKSAGSSPRTRSTS